MGRTRVYSKVVNIAASSSGTVDFFTAEAGRPGRINNVVIVATSTLTDCLIYIKKNDIIVLPDGTEGIPAVAQPVSIPCNIQIHSGDAVRIYYNNTSASDVVAVIIATVEYV